MQAIPKKRYVLFLQCQSASASGNGVYDQVAVTGEHPFWVKGRGWTEAGKIEYDDVLELQGGRKASVVAQEYIQQTPEPNVGWLESAWGFTSDEQAGYRVRFGERSIAIEKQKTYNWEIFDKYERESDRRLRTRVYNLEVEDGHTYYVGEEGAWVVKLPRIPDEQVTRE